MVGFARRIANFGFFYGWVIVAFTFVLQFVVVGLSYYTFGVYLDPLAKELGADRFQVSLALSIQSVVIAVLSPLAGKYMAEKSLRLLLTLGVFVFASGIFLLSQITLLWQLYIVFGGLVGIGMVLLGNIPNNMLLANWFDKRRGRALGISQVGVTISGTVLVPLVTWIILTQGWRVSYMLCGAAAALILLPLVLLLAVRTPEELGQHPDGLPLASEEAASPAGQDWPFSRAVATRDLWFIVLSIGPCFMGVSAVVLAMPSYATDLGFTLLQGSSIVALITFMGALAKPAIGTLADYLNQKVVVGGAVALQAVGVVLLIFASSYNELLVAGFFFGAGYGGMAPLFALLLVARFGRVAFARVMGASMAMLLPFTISALPMTTYIFELYGSYQPAFIVLLGGYFVAVCSVSFLRLSEPAG